LHWPPSELGRSPACSRPDACRVATAAVGCWRGQRADNCPRVGECDLVRQNTARSWVGSLLESIGHAEECGIVRKTIDPGQLGIARYLEDDRIGKDGVEASFEADLRGQMGWEGLLVDAGGQPVRGLPEALRRAAPR